MTPNYVFRARARQQLGSSIFSGAWLMALVVMLIQSMLVSIGSYFFAVVGFMVEGFLAFGIAHVYLSLVRGKKKTVDIGDMFLGNKYLGDNIMLGLMKNVFIALWSLLFVIPGIIKGYSYAMAYYIKYDHPEYDWKTCITESRKMMDGHKWRLFCLEFSFIGWLLLGSLVCGIGVLWVIPYMQAANANFYDDLKAHYEPAPIVVEEATAEAGTDDSTVAEEATAEAGTDESNEG
jgi:uncharacterized membrane protein